MLLEAMTTEGPSNVLLLAIRLRTIEKVPFYQLAKLEAPFDYWYYEADDPMFYEAANHPPQWASGEAFCIRCKYTWAAVAETGTTQLACPECACLTGHWKFGFAPGPGDFVGVCSHCDNQLFYLTPLGHLCANCGIYRSYD